MESRSSHCLKRAQREMSRELATNIVETGSAYEAPTSCEGAGASWAETAAAPEIMANMKKVISWDILDRWIVNVRDYGLCFVDCLARIGYIYSSNVLEQYYHKDKTTCGKLTNGTDCCSWLDGKND